MKGIEAVIIRDRRVHIHNFKCCRLEENTKLEWPYRQLIAIVLKDFEPQDRSHLRLKEGDQIIIIDKEGYRDGWWKAKSKNRVSNYFY